MTRLRGLTSLLLLYAGRAGTAATGLLVLPLLHDRMGTAVFGAAGIILSIQALVVLLDLGLAVSSARESASMSADRTWQLRPLVRHIDRVVLAAYASLGVAAVLGSALFAFGIGPIAMGALVAGLAAITHQNASLGILIGRRDFGFAAISQFAGTLLRHSIALGCLYLFAPTLDVFILAQGGVAVVHALVTRARVLALAGERQGGDERPHDRLVFALAVQGVAGACAMQLDKPILGVLAGTSATAPYYLASVLAIVPLSFLAGPVAQFFQPTVMLALAEERQADMIRGLRRLILALCIATAGPGLVLLVGADFLTALWLGSDPIQPQVAGYLQILIVGGVIGSLGLVPSMLLIARRDYRFLAINSVILTIALLSGVALAAAASRIDVVCYLMTAYHCLATLTLWVRASILYPGLNEAAATAPLELRSLLRQLTGGHREPRPDQ